MNRFEVNSYAQDQWVTPGSGGAVLVSPIDGTEIGRCDSSGLNMASMLDYARETGGKNLRALTFFERAMRLKALATYLNDNKDSLYPTSMLTGATQRDSMVDIDGGISTLFVYASKGRRQLPDAPVLTDGAMERLSRSGNFVGQHILTPRSGTAIHINAFNFPVWGMLEKLAPAFLAGVPVIVKPATVTCYLTEQCVRLIVQSGILPKGALQLIAGGIGDLLDSIDSQDVISFTGSAATAERIKTHPKIISSNARFIAEQDSLNAAVLGLDAASNSDEFRQMIRETVRELSVKAGQKCTVMRRLLIPEKFMDSFVEAMKQNLGKLTIGDPRFEDTKMGPLVSVEQKRDVEAVIARLHRETEPVIADDNINLNGGDADRGAFVSPTLLYCARPDEAQVIHQLEAFGPVATLMPYRDTAHAAGLANRGGGSLVVSMFTQDPQIAREFAHGCANHHGRIYFANGITGKEATGHGAPLPHLVHGGPGRAGGGEELGGLRGMQHYLQRTAIQGNPDIVSAVAVQWVEGSAQDTGGKHPFRLYFDELTLGKSFHSKSRTITMADIETFAEFTGDTFYAHLNEAAASANPFFDGRVAHGYLLLSFAAGLFVDPAPGPVLANTGLEHLRFTRPVYPEDSIRVTLTVKHKAPRTDEYGEVRWHVAILNQNDEAVAVYELLTMNQKRDSA